MNQQAKRVKSFRDLVLEIEALMGPGYRVLQFDLAPGEIQVVPCSGTDIHVERILLPPPPDIYNFGVAINQGHLTDEWLRYDGTALLPWVISNLPFYQFHVKNFSKDERTVFTLYVFTNPRIVESFRNA